MYPHTTPLIIYDYNKLCTWCGYGSHSNINGFISAVIFTFLAYSVLFVKFERASYFVAPVFVL